MYILSISPETQIAILFALTIPACAIATYIAHRATNPFSKR